MPSNIISCSGADEETANHMAPKEDQGDRRTCHLEEKITSFEYLEALLYYHGQCPREKMRASEWKGQIIRPICEQKMQELAKG